MDTNLITIDTSVLPIGKKEIDVSPTGKLGDVNRKTMIKAMEAANPKPNEEYVDYLKRQQEAKNDEMNVLKVALGLTKKELEKINDKMAESDIDLYASYVMSKLEGLVGGSFADYKKAQTKDQDSESDPKK